MGRVELLEDIVIEKENVIYFKEMKNKYKNSEVGFRFNHAYNFSKKNLDSSIKRYEKEFKEKIDINLLDKLLKGEC